MTTDVDRLRADRAMKSPGRLIVDISMLYKNDAGTGIQRVVRNVWEQLRGRCSDIVLLPVFAEANRRFYTSDQDFLDLTETERLAVRQPYIAREGDIFLGLDFSPVLLPRCKHVVAQWKRLGIPVHLVIFDVLPVTNPEWFTRRGVRNYRRWLSFLESYVDSALCISSHVAQEFGNVLAKRRQLSFWRRSRGIVTNVIRLGEEFRARDFAVAVPRDLERIAGRPVILMVGTVEPRKGYDFALQVFDRLWGEAEVEPAVVIVGKAGWKTRQLQRDLCAHPKAGKSLFWLKDINDGELEWLYVNSSVFFSTSYAEGFGLPLVEAQTRGLIVVATDLPVFREFGNGSMGFFEPANVSQAVEMLQDALHGRMHLRSAGRSKPTWNDTVGQILSYIMPQSETA